MCNICLNVFYVFFINDQWGDIQVSVEILVLSTSKHIYNKIHNFTMPYKWRSMSLSILGQRYHGRNFAPDIFKCVLLKEIVAFWFWFLENPPLVHIIVWCQIGANQLPKIQEIVWRGWIIYATRLFYRVYFMYNEALRNAVLKWDFIQHLINF